MGDECFPLSLLSRVRSSDTPGPSLLLPVWVNPRLPPASPSPELALGEGLGDMAGGRRALALLLLTYVNTDERIS